MALSVCLKIFELSPDLNIFNTTSYFKEVVFLFCANVFCGAVYIFFHKKHEIFFSPRCNVLCFSSFIYETGTPECREQPARAVQLAGSH